MLFEYLCFTEILNSNDNKNCTLLGYYTDSSDKHYHYLLCNNLEECRSQLHHGRSLQSHSDDDKLKTIDVINNWCPYWKETGLYILLFYWIVMLLVSGNFNKTGPHILLFYWIGMLLVSGNFNKTGPHILLFYWIGMLLVSGNFNKTGPHILLFYW